MKITVIGAGGWGTALARLLALKQHDVFLWVRDPQLAQEIDRKRTNEPYLPGVSLPKEHLHIFTDLEMISQQGEIFLLVVPSIAVRDLSQQIFRILSPTKRAQSVFINAAKGLEISSLSTMSQVISEELQTERVFTLSGPSHAEEVGRDFPTTVVIAGKNLSLGKQLQQAFMTDRFRVYLSDDLKGVEYAGSVKNVIALAAGISDGLGYGDNAKGALIARGLAEMLRLGVHLGAKKETFFGLSGLGDLVATCTSQHSRNRKVGYRIGRGEKLREILASMEMVAEGVYATEAVHRLAKQKNIEMPITRAVYELLYEDANPLEKLGELMTREPKMEGF
ncbi:NAD(P)-dependent glycerol-3-phosphate dehydrogenase [Candidatus Acetothermia bacterium]|nr:NAD(P)-dependent glycerol-3-phosphate dehydrogenase [Candidatus Acetothermia bacterium]